MSCSYIYNGRQYSRAGLLTILAKGPAANIEKSKEFLLSKLGMLDEQISIVKGLIDNKALGRFLEDGDILLSSFADDRVVYHEAFHRVFRMYLTPEERQAYYTHFRKTRKNAADKYKTLYPENTEEENIEEFLADEFADYMLNNQSLPLDNETKSIFERIINFIKNLLGLKKNRKLYNDIAKGKFAGKPLDKKYRYNKSADKVEINGTHYSYEVKNQFIQAVSREYINEILRQGSVYDFIKNKIDAPTKAALYNQSFTRVAESLIEDFPQMFNDFLDDFEKGPQGYLNNQFKMYIETLIGKFDLTYIEESEKNMDEQGVGEEEKGRQNDDAAKAWTASIEIDPKTNMSKAIKLLLASFEDQSSVNSLGLYSQVRWSNAFNKIAQHLAGIPTSDSIAHLSKLSEPWVADLITYLGGVNPDNLSLEHLRLRNDFIKTFSKTKNTFLLAEVGDDTIKVFDANQNTQEKKKLREWNTAMTLASKKASPNGSFEKWIDRIQTELINARNPSDVAYEELLGITVDEALKNEVIFTQNGQDYYYMSAMKAIATHIVNATKKNNFSDANPPDWNSLFNVKNFDIEGTIKKLAEAQNEYEDVVDLMVFNRDKKLYGISLNTHTSTTVNTLNYIADLIDVNSSIETKLELINKYLPNILNYQTIDKVNGEYVVKSKWLQHIMMGNRINMVIVDGIKNQRSDDEALSDIDESDLYSTTLNLSLRGVNISFKHSDRSTFFAYQLENGQIFDYQNGPYNTEKDIVNYLTTVLQDQLATEVRRSNLDNVPLFQYFKDKYKNSQIFDLKNIQNINPYSPEMEKMIKDSVQSNLKQYNEELTKWGVLSPGKKKSLKGLSQDLLAYHNDNLELAIASSFANQMLTHLEEMKIFLGDFAFFSTADDFYKRMSTTSGTGENLVNDEITNSKIQKMNDIEFQIYSPKSLGESETMKYDKTIDGSFTSITLFEKKDYYAKDAVELTEASPIDGEMITKMQYNFEWNMLQDFENPSQEVKTNIKNLSKEYASNYAKINENDGQSWMNMFFFREYMIRLGNWSQAMENLFKAELQILNARTFEDIANITVKMNGEDVKVFDWKNWDKQWFESVHTLKSQYAGFTQAYTDYRNETLQSIDELQNRIRPYTIYKTSYHVLWPSIIHGTNLSQMHHFMLKNKVDVLHMNSANKSGAIDPKAVFQSRINDLNESQRLVAEKGLNFYDVDGNFNNGVFEGDTGKQLLEGVTTVAHVNSLKDQVKIGNKEKDEIKGSTQSLKILLSNLIVNGKERFPGAADIAIRYKSVINELVSRSIADLMDELGADNEGIKEFSSLVDVIKRAAEDRSSPVNIIEAIEGFLMNPKIESLPNKNKIENIFYSIITNNVISFNRPGNSYPQVAPTGFEGVGERFVKSDLSISSDNEVGFYTTEKDENGNIVKVNAAELILPIPRAWLPEVLKRAKTNNIVEALLWVNNQLATGKLQLTVKGLRIPNQQLSSNDIFKIKKFTLPTNSNFVVVPSGIVTKVGADSTRSSHINKSI